MGRKSREKKERREAVKLVSTVQAGRFFLRAAVGLILFTLALSVPAGLLESTTLKRVAGLSMGAAFLSLGVYCLRTTLPVGANRAGILLVAGVLATLGTGVVTLLTIALLGGPLGGL